MDTALDLTGVAEFCDDSEILADIEAIFPTSQRLRHVATVTCGQVFDAFGKGKQTESVEKAFAFFLKTLQQNEAEQLLVSDDEEGEADIVMLFTRILTGIGVLPEMDPVALDDALMNGEYAIGTLFPGGSLLTLSRHSGMADPHDALLGPINVFIVMIQAAIADARRLADELRVEEVLETVLLREGRWLAARGSWAEAAVAFGDAAAQARSQNHGSFAALAEANQVRARAHAGESGIEAPSGQPLGEAPMRGTIGYLRADAAAELEPSPAVVAALERVADEAARLGDVGLERAAAERLAELASACGDEAAHARALERAALAMAAVEHGLPKDLAEEFAAHPRNASLRAAADRLPANS